MRRHQPHAKLHLPTKFQAGAVCSFKQLCGDKIALSDTPFIQ